jgi:hypothetical protein
MMVVATSKKPETRDVPVSVVAILEVQVALSFVYGL